MLDSSRHRHHGRSSSEVAASSLPEKGAVSLQELERILAAAEEWSGGLRGELQWEDFLQALQEMLPLVSLALLLPGGTGWSIAHQRGPLPSTLPSLLPPPPERWEGKAPHLAIGRRALLLPLDPRGNRRSWLYAEASRSWSRRHRVLIRLALRLLGPRRLAEPALPGGKGLEVGPGLWLWGEHPRMRRLFQEMRRLAPWSTPVLILGESGTGKELVARGLHHLGPRRQRPFLPLNAAALPRELLDSELFGHRRGSFTGASRSRAGLLESVRGGTLFLDELAALPPQAQVALLRPLEEKSVRRIGEERERPVDFRLLSASNVPLAQLREEHLRPDFYQRVCACILSLPPLRRRRSDIPLLAEKLIQAWEKREGSRRRLSPGALRLLQAHDYPGNVRELRNLLESLCCRASGTLIRAREVAPLLRRLGQGSSWGEDRTSQLLGQIRRGEKDFWEDVVRPYREHRLSRPTLQRLIRCALRRSRGRYRGMLRELNLPPEAYRKLLRFLERAGCKPDFRRFR